MASAAKREDGDGLPDGVDADEALQQLIIPRAPGSLSTLPRASVARSYQYVREHGEAEPQDLMFEVFRDSYLDREHRVAPKEWLNEYVAPHLGRLPGVTRPATAWVFDPVSAERPPVPETVHYLDMDEAEDRIQQIGYPGRVTQQQIDQYQTVLAAYKDLRDRDALTRKELWSHHNPATTRQPEDGLYPDSSEWFAAIGYAALDSLPDVRAPAMPAGEWVYVGVGEPTEEQPAGQPAENGEHQ